MKTFSLLTCATLLTRLASVSSGQCCTFVNSPTPYDKINHVKAFRTLKPLQVFVGSPDGVVGSHVQGKSPKEVNGKIDDATRWLSDFTTTSGEVLDPYKTLKVSRSADKTEVKQSYYRLSRKYHPDGVRHRNILPGSCNNLQEVEQEWERVKLSYEILSDRKRRLQYERSLAISDPGAAAGRAALNFLGNGLSGVGKGVWKMGEMAVGQVVKAGAAVETQKS